MVKALPQWETSQQVYGGHYTESQNRRYRADRHFTPNGPKAPRQSFLVQAPDMFRLEQGAANQNATAVPHYGGDHGHQDSEEHMADGLIPDEQRDELVGAHYGKGFEHKDTEDHFNRASMQIAVNETEVIAAVRIHAGAEMGSDQFLLGVAAIPHQGGGHEDKDTIDHFNAGGGFVPDQERQLDGKYGAGHEDLDTLDHFETGTLVPMAEHSFVDSVAHTGPEVANLTAAFQPTKGGSDNRWDPITKRSQTQRKKKGYQVKKINILGIDTSTTRKDRLAWKARQSPSKKLPQRAKSAPRFNETDATSSISTVRSTRGRSAGSVRADSKAAVNNAANLVRSMSAKSVGIGRSTTSQGRSATKRLVLPKSPGWPTRKSAQPTDRDPFHHSGPGKAEHNVEGFDRLLGAGAHYGGAHEGKDTESHLKVVNGTFSTDDAKPKSAVGGQHYGGSHGHDDSEEHMARDFVPDQARDELVGAHYGKGHENKDTEDHFGAGLNMLPEEGAGHFGAVEGDRILGERAPHYGHGHEDKDTISSMKIIDGALVAEGATSADQQYGQHYGADHQNKDTFSNLGPGMIPKARSKYLSVYANAEEEEAAAKRKTEKPKKLRVTYPGTLQYTPHSVDNDVRFRDADLKKSGVFLPGPAATRNQIRGGYVPGKGVTALGENKALRSTRAMMIFPGKAVVKTMNIDDDCRYARYDGKLSKTTASLTFPGYANDPNLTKVAKLNESKMTGSMTKLLDSALVIA